MTVAIVTDSTADLPPDLCARYRIHVVPTVLIVNGREYLDEPGSLSRREFFTRLPEMNPPPTTAAPSSGTFERLYRRLLESGHERVLSIHLAASLSGVYQAARLAAQNVNQAAVAVVDSGQITLGLGFQVLDAARAALEDLPLEDLLARLRSVQERIHLLAMLDTLEYVRRSGRVSWARAALGALLDIKPFLAVRAGSVLRAGQTRTRRKGLQRLAQRLNALGPLEYLALLHSNAEEDARTLQAAHQHPVEHPPLVVNITPVLGTHVGPRGVGFVAAPAA